jgi:acetyltransferase-like isoleucine patch superfamily enzyme
VFIGRNTILSCKNGDIEIGDGANLGFNCEVFSASQVRIGRDTLVAAYAYLIGGDHDFADQAAPVIAQTRRSAGITVGDGAWIGAGAKILDGVSVGDRAIVGASAVVREDVPAGGTAVGIPARLLKPGT